MTKQDIQNYKDKRNLEKGFNTYWNKGFDEAIAFVNKRQEAINYTHSCKSDSELLCACCDKPFKNDVCDECANEIEGMQGIQHNCLQRIWLRLVYL